MLACMNQLGTVKWPLSEEDIRTWARVRDKWYGYTVPIQNVVWCSPHLLDILCNPYIALHTQWRAAADCGHCTVESCSRSWTLWTEKVGRVQLINRAHALCVAHSHTVLSLGQSACNPGLVTSGN